MSAKFQSPFANSSANSKSFQKSLNNIYCCCCWWCFFASYHSSMRIARDITRISMLLSTLFTRWMKFDAQPKTKQAYYEHCATQTHTHAHSLIPCPSTEQDRLFKSIYNCNRCFFSHNHYYHRYCYCFLHWQNVYSLHSPPLNWLCAYFDWIFHAMQSNYAKQAAKCFLFERIFWGIFFFW